MAINFPGPYTVELLYTASGHEHTQKLNCDISGDPQPGTDVADLDFVTKGGGTADLMDAVTAYLNNIKTLYHTSVVWSSITVKKHPDGGGSPTFIASGALSIAGTASAPVNLAHQVTVTMRTGEGKTMRMQFMESSLTGRGRTSVAASGLTGIINIADVQTSTDGWMLGRDTSYLIAPMNVSQTENEALANARFR